MIIGRLGSDPDLKYFSSGSPYARFSVATDEAYNDREGNRVDKTEWHNVVVFNKQAENCQAFLTKGSLVYVEGSLQTRKWEDKEGQTRYMTEIRAQRVQFLDRKGDRPSGGYGEDFDREESRKAAGGNRQGGQRNMDRKPQGGRGKSGAPINDDGYAGAGSESDEDIVPF